MAPGGSEQQKLHFCSGTARGCPPPAKRDPRARSGFPVVAGAELKRVAVGKRNFTSDRRYINPIG